MLLSTFRLDGNDALVMYGNVGLVYEASVQLDQEPAVVTSGTTQINSMYFDVCLTAFFGFEHPLTPFRMRNLL